MTDAERKLLVVLAKAIYLVVMRDGGDRFNPLTRASVAELEKAVKAVEAEQKEPHRG